MADTRVTIHDCAFEDRPCGVYTCRQAKGKKKYFIGNSFGFGQKEVYCEDCIRHLVAHLPAELVDGGGDLEAQLRVKITEEYDTILADKVKEAVAAARFGWNEEVTAEIAELKEQIEQHTLAAVEQTKEEEEETEAVYRCLDCGEEFNTPQKLGSHRRKHKDG